MRRGGGIQPRISRYSLFIIIYKIWIPSASGSLVLKQTKGVPDSNGK